MADAVRARHRSDVEARDHIFGQADFLVDLDTLAGAHDAKAGAGREKRRPCRFQLLGCHVDDRVGALDRDRGRDAGIFERRLEAGEVNFGVCRLDGDFRAARLCAAVDRDARTVGAAVGHRDQHVREQCAEAGLQSLVLQEQSDDAAHGRSPLASARRIRPPTDVVN